MFFKRSRPEKAEQDLKQSPPATALIKSFLSEQKDVVFRDIVVKADDDIKVTLAYTEGVADQNKLSEYILKPLVGGDGFRRCKDQKDLIRRIDEGAIYYGSQKRQTNAEDTIRAILNGGAALLFDKSAAAVTFEIQGFSRRQVSEPTGENIIKGAKDTFVEDIYTNTATLRARLKSPELTVHDFIVGRRSQTRVAIVCLSGIANQDFVDQLETRISGISIDSVQTINQIEEFVTETPYALFPQFLTTERPDKTCGDIAEGRICILVDGLPVALIAPATFASVMKGPEDYAQNPFVMSFITLLRYFSMFLSFLMPGLFVAVETFHPEMLPSEFAISLAASRQGVPLTPIIEAVILLLAFEVLLEAGLRLPKVTGQAVSIVGGIVVGQAAIQAKIVSPGILIAVSLAIITSFALPNRDLVNALRIWRLGFTLLGGFAGLFGIQVGFLWILFSAARIEVLGVPYLAPFAGIDAKNFKDILVRASFPQQDYRPKELKTKDRKRQKHV